MSPVLVSRETGGFYSTSETVIEIGPMLEGMYYFRGRPRGRAASPRAGSVGGISYFRNSSLSAVLAQRSSVVASLLEDPVVPAYRIGPWTRVTSTSPSKHTT